MPDASTVARLQRRAAEHVLDDESWRDGLEDGQASRLLELVLRLTDAAIVQAVERGDAGNTTTLAADVAAQARRLLAALSAGYRGADEASIWEMIAGDLGAPLFPDEAAGRAAVTSTLQELTARQGGAS